MSREPTAYGASDLTDATVTLPPELQQILEQLPRNVDRDRGAALISHHLYPVKKRTIQTWPLPFRLVNGKAVIATATLFEFAYARLMAAPLAVSGGKPKPDAQSQRFSA